MAYYSKLDGIDPTRIGDLPNGKYSLIGYNEKAKTMPYIMKKLSTGGLYKPDQDSAKRYFGKQTDLDELVKQDRDYEDAFGLRTLSKMIGDLNKVSYVNNVSCDNVESTSMREAWTWVKHKEETFFLCLSCRDIDDDELDNLREDLNEYKSSLYISGHHERAENNITFISIMMDIHKVRCNGSECNTICMANSTI